MKKGGDSMKRVNRGMLLLISFIFPTLFGCPPVTEDTGPVVSGTLSVAVDYEISPIYLETDYPGNRGVYIWVTDAEGNYVDTVQQYHDPFRSKKSRWRDDNPLNWINATGREYSLDGVTAASIQGSESGSYLSQEWDCRYSDINGEESRIEPGTYTVFVEITTHDQISVGSGDYFGDDPMLFSGSILLDSTDQTAVIEGDGEHSNEFPSITAAFTAQ